MWLAYAIAVGIYVHGVFSRSNYTVTISSAIYISDHSWFLSALYSICQHKRGCLDDIFQDAKDLDLREVRHIPIKLWRHGNRQKVEVELSLPTKRGKLCFVHSENEDVFWSSLLQKAFMM